MGALQMPYQTAFPPMQAAPFAFNGRDCAACPRLSSSPSAARRTTKCSAGGGEKPRISFGDRILDYIEGGPKLRRWYGASDQLPRDGTGGTADGDSTSQGASPDDEDDDDEAAGDGSGEGPAADSDAVLVTDAESDTGQMVVLQLILLRQPVIALVREAAAAAIVEGFGPYVKCVTGDVQSEKAVSRALRGAKSVVITGKSGCVPRQAAALGQPIHVVLLARSPLAASQSSSLLPSLSLPWLSPSPSSLLASSEDESSALSHSQLRCTVLRAARLTDHPGGQSGVALRRLQQQNDSDSSPTAAAALSPAVSPAVSVSREDLARVAAMAAAAQGMEGRRVIEVCNSPDLPPLSVSDGKQLLHLLSGNQ